MAADVVVGKAAAQVVAGAVEVKQVAGPCNCLDLTAPPGRRDAGTPGRRHEKSTRILYASRILILYYPLWGTPKVPKGVSSIIRGQKI